jgi:hypothetical protein
MKRHLVLASIAAAAAMPVAGCGGGSDSGGGAASLAPPGTVVFVEGTVRPTGQLKANVDQAAASIGGIDNLGEFVVEKLEEEARKDGEPFDYASEVEPWLGDTAGVSFKRVEADGDLSDPVIIVESTDTAATRQFIDSQVKASRDPYRQATYDGVDYEVGGSEGNAVGVIGEFLVVAGESDFKAAVDASSGESLADEDRYQEAVGEATAGSLADAYVDVGGVIEESGDEIDPQARELLQGAGIDPSDATALASVVPAADRVEVDLTSRLGGEEAPRGDASQLLGSLPADSFAAFAVSRFGEQLQEAIDSLDKAGIPGQVPPGKLKSGLKEAGIDLDRISGSLEDAGVFAQGDSERSLGGALVLTTDDPAQAADTVRSIGSLLRSAETPGVTAVSGEASGFSVRSKDLGRKPVVVVAEGNRIAIGYGLAPALAGVASEGGRPLAGTAAYKEAAEALGSTPISAFVNGPAALALAEALVPKSDSGFQEARRYLRSISSIALGSSSEGDLARAKLIVGLGK